MKKAICLLSGGLDSSVCLYVARAEGYEPVALSMEYGQRHHDHEMSAARSLASFLKIKQYRSIVEMPWKGSALLDEKKKIPQHRDVANLDTEIPATYVPARNSIFLSLAISCAEAEGAEAIFIGVNALDYSGYPDCRPEYLKEFSTAVNLGTKVGVEGRKIEVKAPLIDLTKKDIVLLGHKLGVPFEKTWSCYMGGESPCQNCDACLLRAKGFREAGIPDPLFL